MGVTLGKLAATFDCRLIGPATAEVRRVATLSGAGSDAISFFTNPLFRSDLRATAAAAVILDAAAVGDCPVASLVSANPYATYARVAAFLSPAPGARPGVHPSAQVAASAEISSAAEVGPLAVIGERARVEAGAIIGAGSILADDVAVGIDTRLAPHVTVLDGVSIGARCIVHSGAVIGADGFGFAPDGGEWVKVPQLGKVVIGNDVEIGANTTIDRGTIESTVIGDGVKLDNLVQIAHNVRVGDHTVMAAMSGAAGSTRIGRRCMIGGGTVMINHLEICDDVLITFRSVVTKSIKRPGTYSGSLPADEASQWRRNAARFRTLDRMAGRLRSVEAALRQSGSEGTQDDDD